MSNARIRRKKAKRKAAYMEFLNDVIFKIHPEDIPIFKDLGSSAAKTIIENHFGGTYGREE